MVRVIWKWKDEVGEHDTVLVEVSIRVANDVTGGLHLDIFRIQLNNLFVSLHAYCIHIGAGSG